MYSVIVIFHVLACLALILIVLLQTGRGAEMGAAFGGASQTLFGGAGGSTFLGKLTTGAAIVFMLTCLSLTYLSVGPSSRSLMEDVPASQSQGTPVPEAKPVQPVPEPTRAPESAAKPSAEAVTPTEGSAQPAQGSESAPQPVPAGTSQGSAGEEKKSQPAVTGQEEKKPEAETRSQGKKQGKSAEPVRKQ
ncbi:MAG: preprotein translocase subunit SecG [Deltaproteobacteria bacterium]|nr:preprotein translocase subunit SecG [Deltaproteobacteria bacterium]